MLDKELLVKVIKEMSKKRHNDGTVVAKNKDGVEVLRFRILIKYAKLPRHHSGCLVTPSRLYWDGYRKLETIFKDMRQLNELLAESDKHIPLLSDEQRQELKDSLSTLIEKIDLTKKMLKEA